MNDPKKNNAERLGAVRINNGQIEAQLLRERDPNGAMVVHAVRRTAHVHERLRSAGKLAPELFDAAEKFRMDFERSGARFTHSLLEKTRNLGCSGKRRLIGREGAEESTRSGFDPVATASNSTEVYRPPTARAVRSSGCRIRLDKKQSHGAAVGSASPKPGRRYSG